jgi:hypothetical protein
MNATTTLRGAADWMDMTAADWLDLAPSEWLDRSMPGWRESTYGEVLHRTPREWMTTAYQPLYGGPVALPRTRPGPGRRPHPHYRPHHRHHHDCNCGCHERHDKHHEHGCRPCREDSCECYCCVGDVDLVVYTRVGERRIVPISIENERRREREVTLELSDWATRGGRTGAVTTLELEPKEFTLPACGEQKVQLAIEAHGESDAADQVGADRDVANRELHDVDECLVVKADLRLVGCDHRAIRIAAAILPRDCEPFRVNCGCGCC